MSDEFCGLLDPGGFVPRAICGRWSDWEILLNNVSDLLMALAYVLIPVILVYFTRRRRDLPFSWMFLVFGAFIITCGCTHILEIVLFYYPVYHLAGWLKALTALASWAAVLCLIKIVPAALSLRSPAELEREILSRQLAEGQLAEKNRRLEEAERLKDQFLANVSHELRTPLTLILSPAESLLSAAETPASQRPTLELIRGNALRLLRQVNELLDYSRYTSGKLEVNRQSTEVVALSKQLVASFEPLAQQRQIRLQFSAPNEEARWLDQYLYERILFNLVSNALKYARKEVGVEVAFAGEQVILKVIDDGKGIPAEDRQVIFERFRQGDAQDRLSGTGLGLALVREFASVLGGSVEVLEGPGARFQVHLLAPVSQLPGQFARSIPDLPPEPVLESPPPSEGLPRVLLAEDEPELAAYMSLVLRGVANVQVVRDGGQAMAQLDQWQPELILSDVMMPGLSGFELCRQLKASPRWAAVPVILITALTHREALLQGWESGADEFLFKPFHPTELITRVRTLLTISGIRRRLELDLRQQVEEQTALLSTALQRAEVANEAKTRFLGNLSHELRTPLAVVLGMVQLAMGESPPLSIQEKLEKIRDSASGLNGLLEDLVEFCRLESGQLKLRRAAFELRAFLTNLHTSLAPQAQERNLEWVLEIEGPQPWWVEGDEGRLRHVLINLLVNAIKFTQQGWIRLKLDSSLTFSVSDTGQGVAPEDQQRILERFVQVDDSLKRDRQGLGLGLAICSELLQLMGTRLQLTSQLGQGSRFWFQLELPQATPPAPQPQTTVRPRRILLVEDHPLNRAAMGLMLERAGHQVSAAQSGAEALSLLETQGFEVAVLDLQLPDMDGLEICARLQATHPELPLIALTAHAGEEWRQRCLQAGFRAFLTKPVAHDQLLSVIAQVS
ncbi:response regulator [bacterium]|nr:response regulator [bacterium]